MRIGLMIGPERGRYRQKVAQLVGDAEAAEAAGFASIWVPQVPGDFDAFTAMTLMGRVTARIEIGSAVLPIQTRHPLALAQEALSCQAVCDGRLTLGLGTSHHWIVEGMLGLSYARPAAQMRDYLQVLHAALRGPGAVDVENERFRVHGPIDVTDLAPPPVLLAALGPVMLRLAGEQAAGTILWMADERAIGEHVVPRLTKAAAGRPAPRVVAGVPVTVCARAEAAEARALASRVFDQAGYSPNYQRLLARGDAADAGDLLAAGDESAVAARLRAYRDAGATDLAARVVPFGADRAARLASRARTLALLASLGAGL